MRQNVEYKRAISAETSVTFGVIQGLSVYSTLSLFIGFIYDQPEVNNACEMWLYADNSKTAGKAVNETNCCTIQQDLNALGEWSISNQITLSLDKCACLHFGHNIPGQIYNTNGVTIKSVDQCSDLSVLRVSNFRHNAHIDMIFLKASRLSGVATKAVNF